MTGEEAVQWIRNQCEIHGDNFATSYAYDGAVEVRVNDRLVFGFFGARVQDFRVLDVQAAYEVGRVPLVQEANPNDHLWHNELPPLAAQRMQWIDENNVVYNPELPDLDGRFAYEGVWHNDDEYARQVLPGPEIVRGGSPLFLVDQGDVIEGNLEDVRAETKINLLKPREGKVAQAWTQGWNALTASTLEIGSTYDVDQYGNIIGTRALTVVLCKSKKHYIVQDVEFCEKCCWTCQAADEAPFCKSCRKTMRAEEKEGESVRSFASEHFPSLVPFLD